MGTPGLSLLLSFRAGDGKIDAHQHKEISSALMEAALAARGVSITAEGKEFLKGAFKSILGQVLASTSVSGKQTLETQHMHGSACQVEILFFQAVALVWKRGI